MTLQDFVKTEYTAEQKEAQRQQEMKDALMEEAGLEGKTCDELRRTMLSASEAIAAKTEQLDDIRARKSRKKDWDEYVDAKRRWGRALHHSEIIPHLRQLVPNLFVCDGMVKNTLSLFTWDRSWPFEIDGNKKAKIGGTVYQGWMQYGYSPEYEIDITDKIGVAKRQIRGWRTVLIRMITRREPETFIPCSLFSEEQAWELFGSPTNGDTASKWREHLYKFRNTSPEQAKIQHEILEKAQRYRYA